MMETKKLTEKISDVADSMSEAIESYDTPFSRSFYKKHFGKMIILGLSRLLTRALPR